MPGHIGANYVLKGGTDLETVKEAVRTSWVHLPSSAEVNTSYACTCGTVANMCTALCPDGTTVPWHRVLNAAGALSPRAVPGAELTQRQLLEQEGVPFNLRGRVPLERVRWRGTRIRR